MKEINCVDMSATVGEDHISYLFLETVRDCFFYQQIIEPTRIRELSELTDIHITEEQVIKTINQLNPSKSQGPDQIHHKLIKEIKDLITTPLTIIFSKSISRKQDS